MTAFMLAPYADRVEILSDGAKYTADGIYLGSTYKVALSDDVPLAVVGSGVVSEISALADTIMAAAETTKSVDETIALLRKALKKIARKPNLDTGMRMAIGAISERSGPVCFVFSTFVDPASSVPPFALQEMPRAFAQGAAPTGEDMAGYGHLSISEGLEADAAFLFNCMRRQPLANPAAPGKESGHTIGGHLDFTVVRAESYETRQLLTWPDVVGEKIDPTRASRAA
ncbi:hypothetical protein [Affinirhizobium pseudoryzae]|uniref:hypothetical protein n=1 Tax=Allorhizobium pseudoryzae TaxID=379684 RepID=UPI0013EAB506|nr:hypothetical protein [Allorhizobium pseudoryzae]